MSLPYRVNFHIKVFRFLLHNLNKNKSLTWLMNVSFDMQLLQTNPYQIYKVVYKTWRNGETRVVIALMRILSTTNN